MALINSIKNISSKIPFQNQKLNSKESVKPRPLYTTALKSGAIGAGTGAAVTGAGLFGLDKLASKCIKMIKENPNSAQLIDALADVDVYELGNKFVRLNVPVSADSENVAEEIITKLNENKNAIKQMAPKTIAKYALVGAAAFAAIGTGVALIHDKIKAKKGIKE